ncbi:hypothetical protein GCK72_025963 [Caenorhabditis remanei]|uniref:Uncharacterized protein n=1 Tax=Caenorhabditis remanei TaxID=31234 RepID=A0A6A5G464_CAERE|nr:hypothetical protein GCK72_025963 [Caenorhabditis remanei]KAF1749495.1 hypothetical protein GCK72_025963 [Caenorhabditis remanei]
MNVVNPTLWLLAVLTVVQTTNFRADGTLSCSLSQKWCYLVELSEKDTLPMFDDRIGDTGFQCVDTASVGYSIIGSQQGDGLENYFYEITMSVAHNCTQEPGTIKKINRNTAYASVFETEIFVQWNVDLTDQGSSVIDYSL